MNTPIYDFIQQYRSKNPVRAHMPGHKGRCALPCGFGEAYGYDITEIEGADVLFEAGGIIAESERNAASLFGTAGTFILREVLLFAFRQCLLLCAERTGLLSVQGIPTGR